jgi:hypothetical protein
MEISLRKEGSSCKLAKTLINIPDPQPNPYAIQIGKKEYFQWQIPLGSKLQSLENPLLMIRPRIAFSWQNWILNLQSSYKEFYNLSSMVCDSIPHFRDGRQSQGTSLHVHKSLIFANEGGFGINISLNLNSAVGRHIEMLSAVFSGAFACIFFNCGAVRLSHARTR